MEMNLNIKEVKPNIFFVDGPGPASNLVYLKSSAGVLVIDTTTSQEEMQTVLDMADISASDVTLLINTHADGDHILGNGLFDCPIVAHQLTYDRMKDAGRPKAELPTKTFSGDKYSIQHGEYAIELVYTGGHKKDMTMVWLLGQRVLFASDIIFQGRYPYMLQSDVPTWIEALKTLPNYQADVLLPGHGTVCTVADVELLLDYMENTWQLVKEHRQQGHPLPKIMNDSRLPRPEGWIRENFFQKNIEYMVELLD